MTLLNKITLLTLFVIVITNSLFSQPADTTLSLTVTGNQFIEATNSITFAAGFSYSAGSTNQLVASIIPTTGNSNYTFIEPQESGSLPINTSFPVGTINGSISVGPTGAANYIIPIDIPQGRNGMKPNLSLVYNSQGAEGLLGIGWALSGLSAITRIPTDFYHDYYVDPVDFDSNDKFALDGTRLISLGDGQYRTEIESFTKITLYGSSTNPTSFKAETKEGFELYYGNTSDSRIEAQGTTNVYAWNLNQVKDKNGNFYTVTYYETTDSGEIYPATINYTCYGSTPGNYSIEFGYETRSIPRKTYISGSLVQNKKLMNLISIKHGATTVGKYQLVYSDNKLSEIIKYGKNNSRLNSTSINWGPSDAGLIESSLTTIPDLTRCKGDYNGDGKMDMVIIRGDPVTYYLYLADSTGQLNLVYSHLMPTNFVGEFILPGDYNGDGLEDIFLFRLFPYGYYQSFLISDGDSFTFMEYSTPITNLEKAYAGDFDGNGATDIMIKATSGYNCVIFKYSFLDGGEIIRNYINQNNITWGDDYEYTTIKEVQFDMNGDGANDLLTLDEDQCRVYSMQDGSMTQIYSNSYPNSTLINLFGDFNGDGMTDIFSFDQNDNWKLNISKGNGFTQRTINTFTGFIPWYNPQYNNFYAYDMNSDGKSDIAVIGKRDTIINPVRIYVGYSNGENFSLSTYNPQSYLQVSPNDTTQNYNHFGDFNGDGVIDLYYEDASIARLINTYRGRSQYFISEIKNGLGHSDSINYAPLTSSAIYSKGAATHFPVISYQAPTYVVVSINSINPDLSNNITYYSYFGGHLHKQGRGFLGFEKLTSRNTTTNFQSVDEYEYDTIRFISALKKRSLFAVLTDSTSEELISETLMTNKITVLPEWRYFCYVDSLREINYLKGISVLKDYTYDSNGNLTSYREDFDDGSYNSTTYSNFSSAGSWLPAKPQTITEVRKHYQDSQTFSLTNNFTYYSVTGQVNTKTVGFLTTTYSYDSYGNLTSETVSDGSTSRTNTYVYETQQNMFLWKSFNSLNHKTERTFDYTTGNILTEIAPNNVTTYYFYDDFGTLVRDSTPALGQKHYCRLGWTTGTRPLGSVYYKLVIDSGAPSVKEYFDFYGRVLRKEATGFEGDLIYTSNVYNTKGQLVESSLPYKQEDIPLKTEYFYDKYGQIIREESTSGIVNYLYSGKTTQIINSAGQTSSKTLDSQGNVISTSDDVGSISYSYKSVGKPGTITSVGSSLSMQYDNLGRQISLTDPDAGIIQYRYNKYNELTRQTDARGKIDSLTYDVLGRVATEVREEGIKIYKYDPSGNPGIVDSITYPGGSTKYTYDNFSRLTSKVVRINGSSYSTAYGYDRYSRIKTQTYPSSFAIKNIYDDYGFLIEVRRDNNALIWQGQSVNAFGQLTQYKYGNNLVTTKTYDCLGMLRQISCGSVQSMSFSFDQETGNLLSRKDNLNTLLEMFTYDKLNRLTDVSGPTPITMAYYSNGNIQSKTFIGTYAYEGSKPHSVTSVTNPDGLISSITQRITYTSFNKVDSIIQSNLVYTLDYGEGDQRLMSRFYDNGTLQKTVYYVGDYEREIKPGNHIRQLHYILGGDGLTAIFVKNDGLDTIYYVHTDHLGSINIITNQSGTVIKKYCFDAWGRRRNPTNWTYNNISSTFLFSRGFTGHEHLDQFGLINMNGRVYDPFTGRFLSPDLIIQDPGNPQNFNRYTYCLNNPLIYTDPEGESILAAILIGAFINNFIQTVSGNVDSFGDWVLSLAVGGLSGAAGFGAGQLISGALGASTTLGGSVLNGALTGSAGGFAGGFVGGAGNAWAGGASFSQGLSSGLRAGSFGALTGGVIGGISAAIQYGKQMAVFRNGNAELGIQSGNPVPATDDFLSQSQEVWYPDAPMNNVVEFTVENVPAEQQLALDANHAAGRTKGLSEGRLYTGKSNVYFNKNLAFTSAKRLFFTMGHEFVHVSQFASLTGLPTNIVPNRLLDCHAYSYEYNVLKSGNYGGFAPSDVRQLMIQYPNYFQSLHYMNFPWTTKANFIYPF